MPYTDDNGIIYDDQGQPIGVKPRSYRTPEGTWNYYPNKKAIRASNYPTEPPATYGYSDYPSAPVQSADPFHMDFGAVGAFLGGGSGKKRKNPYDISI